MKVDKVYSIYYSATGTTQKIVSYIGENIAKKLNVDFEKYNFTLPKKREGILEFKENDLVICGTPTYAGRIPNVMLPYYKNNIKANGALAIPVVLYGNRNFDDSLIELRNTMQENGFYTIAGAGFIGEHAFSYTLVAGRPDDKDMAIAAEFVDKVVEKIKNMTDIPKEPIKVRGNDPIRPYYMPKDKNEHAIDILKVKPKVDTSKCTNCKTCAHVCPLASIDFDDITKYVGKCIKCGACIKKCPEHCRYYDDEGFLYHQHDLEDEFKRRAEPELFY
ncbi:EFR1 family ferrodoxin [Brachyspira hyodysenteriae]|uniref:EFR1 family ferrodoxin n=1 Tax=Brachyspira hyodysenteriae TaxID=159 RepID=UPI0022CDFA0E|nr:EFR1 family ferrodoxin [Brachyspira hyodysenteriae]MCZ9889561.1 EFR1 family ferrodoxin [Brachyspira hyodysenteriae]